MGKIRFKTFSNLPPSKHFVNHTRYNNLTFLIPKHTHTHTPSPFENAMHPWYYKLIASIKLFFTPVSLPLKLFLAPLWRGVKLTGYTIKDLKEAVSGNAVIYVRPIQSDMDMTPVEQKRDGDTVYTRCVNCHGNIPLFEMKEHAGVCNVGKSASPSDRP